MNDTPARKIKTGGDPRTLPDYALLRDELNKLTHPARPDVNWQYVEKLCLSLFEQNGVELQTAAWYTLARTHLAGLNGLNEGLGILEALISHQWGAIWPQAIAARVDILNSLSQRLQQLMRTWSLKGGDLKALYLAEQRLSHLGAVLEERELKHLSQLDTLRNLNHNGAVRLENADGSSLKVEDVGENAPQSADKWVYVVESQRQPNVDVSVAVAALRQKWAFFAAGMSTMLLVSLATAYGWHALHQPDPQLARLDSTLAPLPQPLSAAQLQALKPPASAAQSYINATQRQLAHLERLSPDWTLTYSRQLLEQAQTLWPEQATPLQSQWQRQIKASALPTEKLNGWHQGMTTLQKLSDRLNGLDEQKGKYMTVSELKSVVFSTMQSFNQSIPVEEQLRVLAQYAAGEPLPEAARSQLEMHLKQLIARYTILVQPEMYRINENDIKE